MTFCNLFRGFWAGVESVIFDDTTVYNRHFEGPGSAMQRHCGAAFLECILERTSCDFVTFFGPPGLPF